MFLYGFPRSEGLRQHLQHHTAARIRGWRGQKFGWFDFAEGMTVLHAIALAGGFDKAQMEPWQIAEMTRESRAFRRLSIRRA
jgi:hypothetical protein